MTNFIMAGWLINFHFNVLSFSRRRESRKTKRKLDSGQAGMTQYEEIDIYNKKPMILTD
jgi:hypothetical protein